MDENTVDTLRIEIEADAKKAKKSIDDFKKSTADMTRYLKDIEKYGYMPFDKWKDGVDFAKKLKPLVKDVAAETKTLQTETKKLSSSFKGLSAQASKFSGLKLAGAFGGIAKSGASRALDSFKNSFAGINKQLNYFGMAIKNVLVYSILSRMLGAITKAVQTGTENLYQYSKIIDGKFAASMDRLAASFQYFQNSISAAIAPIINAFAPAIDLAVDKVVELINAFSQMIAKLTGASSWTKAVKVPKEYAEAADKASKANKNLLASFDELNVIQSKDSGSGKTVPDYGSMFEEVPLDGYSLPDFVQQIKDKINEGDWRGVGETLGEKVNEITSSVNWADLGAKVGEGLQGLIDAYNGFMETVDWTQIGTGLGDALNNLMANVDPESVGAAFAQVWNAITETIYGFVTATDWTAVGQFIAGTINGWFDTIDWTLLGKTISESITALLETMTAAVETTDWKSIGGDISTAINEIEWSTLFSSSTELISEAVEGLLDLLTGAIETLEWDDFGSSVWDSMIESVMSIDYSSIVSKIFEFLGAAWGADLAFKNGFFDSVKTTLVEDFKESVDAIQTRLEESGGNIFKAILTGIKDAASSIKTWIVDNIFTPFTTGFDNAFGTENEVSSVMMFRGGYIMQGMFLGLKEGWELISPWVSSSLEWLKTSTLNAFDELKNKAPESWRQMWNNIKGIANSILGGIEKMVNGVIRGFNSMIGSLNKLSFDVPDWVPGIGGEKFGFSISTIPEAKLPRLASGGVVTGPTFAQIGEYPGAASNPEIVAPQSVIYDTVVSANGEQERLLREQNSLLRQLLQKENTVVIAPSAAWGRMNAKSNQLYAAAKGAY